MMVRNWSSQGLVPMIFLSKKMLFHFSVVAILYQQTIPDSKCHGANMGSTWVLLAPDGPHVCPMNLAIRDELTTCFFPLYCWYQAAGDTHDDVIKWKHFPRNWPFVRGIHRSPVNSPHKGQWRGALKFSLICARINSWVNNGEAGDLRRHHGHYDVIVMPTANANTDDEDGNITCSKLT